MKNGNAIQMQEMQDSTDIDSAVQSKMKNERCKMKNEKWECNTNARNAKIALT